MLYEDFLIVCLINICEVALKEYCSHLLVVENQKSSEEVVLILSNSKITIFCCIAVGFYKEYEFEKRIMIIAGLLYIYIYKEVGGKNIRLFLFFLCRSRNFAGRSFLTWAE